MITFKRGAAIVVGLAVVGWIVSFSNNPPGPRQAPAITGSPDTAGYTEREWQAYCSYWVMGATGDPRDAAVCKFRADKAKREREAEIDQDFARAKQTPLYHSTR